MPTARPIDLSKATNVATPDGFNMWLYGAEPGAVCCYAMEFHLKGNSVGASAWDAYEKGHVELVRKRVGERFAYLAIKRRWVQPVPKPYYAR